MHTEQYLDGTLVFTFSDVVSQRPRWRATVTYLTVSGQFSLVHQFEELEDLHDIVESGPSFAAISDIKVELNAYAPTPLELLN